MSSKLSQLGKDVYRDLRDRRLLIIAVALVLAMIAVPLLVKGEPATPVDSGASGVVTEPSELDAVVVAEDVGLRDYRERLDGLHGQNPFEQQLTGSPGGDKQAGDGGGSGGLPTEESLATTSGSTASTASASVTTASDPEVSPTVEESEPEEPDAPEATEVTKVVSFSIDVKVGPVGDARVIREVEVGDPLPGRDHPILQYLSTDIDETASSFALSREVVGTSGEGHCAPNRARCDFLELGLGEEQELELDSSETTIRIKLLDIIRHERTVPEASPDSE